MAIAVYDPKVLWREASIFEDFSKILNFCPSSILEKAKRRRDSNKLFRHDPALNDFVKLDNIIKIDKDDEEVKLFSNTVFQCVETLGKCIAYSFDHFNCKVLPTGSFPLNLKIEAIDEFDFVLILDSKLESYKIENWVKLAAFHKRKELADLVKDIFLTCNCDKLLCEMNLFQKSYAVNIVISWICSSNHRHSVSLDLALALKLSTTVQEFFESSNVSLNGTQFDRSINGDVNMCWNCGFDQERKGRVDTNIFDQKLFKKCDSISPNTKLCLRIAKFICAHTFPRTYKTQYCLLKKKWVNYTKPIYSSYVLKQLYFREINEFPSSDDWKIDVIPIRLASILENFLIGSLVEDLIDEKSKKSIEEPEKFFREVLIRLIEWLRNDCRKVTLKPKLLNNSYRGIARVAVAKVNYKGELRPAVGSDMIIIASESVLSTICNSCFYDFYSFFRVETFESQMTENNIFCGVYQNFDGALNDMKQIDLSTWNVAEAEKIILLLTCGIITEEDVDSAYYTEKLNAFNDVLQSYGITHFDVFNQELRLWYAIIFSEKSMALPLEQKAIRQMTWKDAGCVYQNPHKLSHFPILKDQNNEMQVLVDSIKSCSKQYASLYKLSFEVVWLLASLRVIQNMR